MTEELVDAPGATLCVEAFGAPGDPAVLLIAGAAQSMDWWEPAFCARLAGAGRFVVRYDHRDTGRSTRCPPGRPDYGADELGTDPLRVLDALGVERAHVVGLSMGGGITQQLAAHHAARVRSATLVATSPAGDLADARPLPPPEPRVAASFTDPRPEPDWDDRAAVVEHLLAEQRLYAGPAHFDEAGVRRVVGTALDRGHRPASAANHGACAGDTTAPFRMADIAVPTLVLHGSADPLFPLPHGRALAAEIPGARLVELPGTGHEEPPPPLWGPALRAIIDHTT